MSNISKDMRMESFQIFEASKLMWPQAHLRFFKNNIYLYFILT
jgi:hypothetical protein